MNHEARKTALFIRLEDAIEMDRAAPLFSKLSQLRATQQVVMATVFFDPRSVGPRESEALARCWECGMTLIALGPRIQRYDPKSEDVSPLEGYMADMIVAQSIGRVVLPRRDLDFLPLAHSLQALGLHVQFGVGGLLTGPQRDEPTPVARRRPWSRPILC